MDYSVVIVGGGPAGALAALRLAKAGLRVLVIDRPRPTRVEAAEILSPQGRTILEQEKVWNDMPLDLTWPCPSLATAWDGPELTWTSFGGQSDACAWHIDRIRFDAWMTRRIQSTGVVVVAGAVDRVQREDAGWTIAFSVDGATRSASSDFLIHATGRSSSAFGLAPRHRIDNLCLIAGITEPDPTDPDALIVEATADGWWYSAPLISGALFCGWMTDFSLLSSGGDVAAEDRSERIGQYESAAAESLKGAPIHAKRIGTPRLSTIIGSATWAMSPCAGPGWIAIGDAALARDPISGDGLVSALQSGCEGADVVLRAANGDASVWTSTADRLEQVSRRYQQRRLDLYRLAQKRWPTSEFWKRF